METYFCCLRERLLDVEIPSKKFKILTKEKRESLHSLKDDHKGAGKGTVVVAWDREDYLKEAYGQLDEKEVYEQVQNNPNAIANTLIKAL